MLAAYRKGGKSKTSRFRPALEMRHGFVVRLDLKPRAVLGAGHKLGRAHIGENVDDLDNSFVVCGV